MLLPLPVKLATEQVQLTLTLSALGKAELYAKLADRRVLEIVRMAGESKPEQIELTARRLKAHLTKIAVLSSTQEVTTGITMAPAVEGAPAAKGAPVVEETLAVEETPILPERGKGGKPVRVDRRARLRAIVAGRAINHPARLHALLETAPESAKPALLRAIAVSRAGYEKALESLD